MPRRSRDIPPYTRVRVYVTHAGRCAFPGCNRRVVESYDTPEELVTRQQTPLSHIMGVSPDSARFNPEMSDEEVNSFENVMLFCGEHHGLIDSNPNEYTIEKLLEMKENHCRKMEMAVENIIPNINFAHLEVILDYLIASRKRAADLKFPDNIPPPLDITRKIQRNSLSEDVHRLLIIGGAKVDLVTKYIEKNVDTNFGEKLKTYFVEEYEKLIGNGLEGDNLFFALTRFATGGKSDFEITAGGLAVLRYFFETCDVFEE